MRLLPAIAAITLLSGCGTMQIAERNFIRPDHKADTPRAVIGASLPAGSVSEEAIVTEDGAVLRGVSWMTESDLTILYFGGNAFNLDKHGASALRALTSCGVNVTVFDHRGYGRSSGKPTVALMAADGLRAFDLLNARHPGRVIVQGQSLGSFIAAHVAANRPATRALILESTSTTVQDWTDANVPWYVKAVTRVEVEPVLRQVDNVKAAASYAGPALVMTGANDRITPAHLARRVFDALPTRSKLWLEAKGAGHNDVLGNPGIMPAYCGFIRSLK